MALDWKCRLEGFQAVYPFPMPTGKERYINSRYNTQAQTGLIFHTFLYSIGYNSILDFKKKTRKSELSQKKKSASLSHLLFWHC
jgi:hypothetical protein